MKKILFGLLLLFAVTFVQASHITGGTLGWQCLSNGQYRFVMEVYRDCGGIPLTFGGEVIGISGSPLPTDTMGNPIDRIAVKADSARWLASNNGNLSPRCNSGGVSCTGGGVDPIQVFWYLSDPITLNGIPPTDGWVFSWLGLPFRSTDVGNYNIPSGSRIGLQAQMFAFNNRNVTPCYDSSPMFKGDRNSFVCRNYTFTYNQIAEDNDQDSLTYNKEHIFNQAFLGGPLTPVPFRPPFSLESPTPNIAQNPNNVNYTLDSLTGLTRLAIFSGNGVERFVTGVRVDAYREGQKISSSYRDRSLIALNCPNLSNGQVNTAPQSYLNGVATESIHIDVAAGQLVRIPLQFIDNDSSGQTITLIPVGDMFTSSKAPNSDSLAVTPRQKGSPCALPGVEPCAYLENTSPSLDTVQQPAVQSIRAVENLNTEFVWQTDCNHLKADGSAQSYNFYFNAFDDHCDVPYFRGVVIRIRVSPSNSLLRPTLDCVQQHSNGKRINWSSNLGQTEDFQSIEIYKSDNRTSNFSLLETITDSTQISYLDINNPSQMAFYYLRVNADDCNGNSSVSLSSDTLSVEPLQLRVENTAECFQLTWNYNPKSARETYSIYREFPVGSGFVKIDAIVNDSIYCDPLVNCSDQVNYYVVRENNNMNCLVQSNTVSLTGSNFTSTGWIRLDDRTFNLFSNQGSAVWYSCSKDSIYTDSINTSFSPQDTGSYGAILTQFGCSDTTNCLTLFSVGIEENTLQGKISLFPNPNTGTFNLNGLEAGEEYEISIRNLQGQLIQEQVVANQTQVALNLEGDAGIYFVQLKNRKGEQANFKVIKQ